MLRGLDVVLLPPFGASAEQDNEGIAVLAEVDSVTWTEIHTQFEHTGAAALSAEPVEVDCDPSACGSITGQTVT